MESASERAIVRAVESMASALRSVAWTALGVAARGGPASVKALELAALELANPGTHKLTKEEEEIAAGNRAVSTLVIQQLRATERPEEPREGPRNPQGGPQ